MVYYNGREPTATNYNAITKETGRSQREHVNTQRIHFIGGLNLTIVGYCSASV